MERARRLLELHDSLDAARSPRAHGALSWAPLMTGIVAVAVGVVVAGAGGLDLAAGIVLAGGAALMAFGVRILNRDRTDLELHRMLEEEIRRVEGGSGTARGEEGR